MHLTCFIVEEPGLRNSGLKWMLGRTRSPALSAAHPEIHKDIWTAYASVAPKEENISTLTGPVERWIEITFLEHHIPSGLPPFPIDSEFVTQKTKMIL